ncbi:hypothetical protein PRK78_002780 [Emydomyces testavorans]|uniref:Uncharacterized protein n=1 Tax=Emydomyces testavorans TaxID=2070801 RepID=A0AAF0DEY3_9EURO|nr:hypothetical protein PRK78_002780 [Emydomyces testavorans]
MLADRPTTICASKPPHSNMTSSLRASSPTPSGSRPRHSSKTPTFHLGTLPRFHPAVYQGSNPNNFPPQPPAPVQQRSSQQYRASSNSRDVLRQYRELVAGITSRGPTSVPCTKPSKPRLDPTGSPGPVTPLTLEEQEDGYFTAGAVRSSESRSRADHPPPKEMLERLLHQEHERISSQNGSWKDSKGR